MRAHWTAVASLAAAALAIGGVATAQKPAKAKVDRPTITCADATQVSISIRVSAGGTGAPAGFSLQWMTAADLADNGGWYASDDPRLCKASFSGNANLSRYNLGPDEWVTVNVGDFLLDQGASVHGDGCVGELACGTEYVFRVFAHAATPLQRSDFTEDLYCSTLPCGHDEGCTFTQGYWKNHEEAWPTEALTLGTVSYTKAELVAILNQPVMGNGLVALAHQLIATKLNIAGGADPTDLGGAVDAADNLIGALVVPPHGGGSLPSSATGDLIETLREYNEGAIGPGHCQ